MKTLLLAGWIAPMDGPVIREGGIVFDQGMIAAVGAGDRLRQQHPDAAIQDAGDVLLLPGLVNAHVHLELSDAKSAENPRISTNSGSDPRISTNLHESNSHSWRFVEIRGSNSSSPGSFFVDWLKAVITRRIAEADKVDQVVSAATAQGLAQCLRYGITALGDISRLCHITRPILAQSPLLAVSYGEVQAMGQRRTLLGQRLAAAGNTTCATQRLRVGLTPHAPYSIEGEGYRRCLELARQDNLPLATHLAESPDEAAFLAEHSGPLRQLWEFLGWWDEQVPRFEGGPIRLARSLGLLDYPTLLAHVNYCDDEELAILAAGRASVVYCPRTHAYFGHPPHRWRDMLRRGINVAVGTDSCASSPDLNLVDDLRLLHRLAPEVATQHLWQMATTRAAAALGLDRRAGSISPGKSADFVAFAANTCDPLSEVLETPLLPQRLWIQGQAISPVA